MGEKGDVVITDITLENFKCFRHLDIEPKLVTVLIGPNGTGKSGVLQALLLLKQSKDSVESLTMEGDLMRFAPEAFMLHGLNPAEDTVHISLSGYWAIEAEAFETPVEFDIDLRYSDGAKLVGRRGQTKFRISGQEYEFLFDHELPGWSLGIYGGTINYKLGDGINDFRVTSYSGTGGSFRDLYPKISQAPSDAFRNMKVVPAARALGRGTYRLGPQSSVDIPSATGLGQQEEDLATTLVYSRPEVEKLSNMMRQVTGVGFRVDTVEPVSAKPISESPAGDFSLTAEGFGTNTLVHLLFELGRAAPRATVLIEEPEVHLHPKAQADLASVLVEEAKAAEKQLIMTTHSEHIAGRLLTLVAEDQLSPDEVAIYSFEKDESGVCSAHQIEVTEHGQVKGGLKSFFQTDLDEMRRYVDALRART